MLQEKKNEERQGKADAISITQCTVSVQIDLMVYLVALFSM